MESKRVFFVAHLKITPLEPKNTPERNRRNNDPNHQFLGSMLVFGGCSRGISWPLIQWLFLVPLKGGR